MPSSVAGALAVLGVLTLINLVLTCGVIRRLREYEARHVPDGSMGPELPAPGTPIPDFSATTVDGCDVTHTSYSTGIAYVGFFSPACPPCREQLPRFLATVRAVDPRKVLIVIADDAPAPSSASAALPTDATDAADADAAGRIVVEAHQGPVASAFAAHALPTLLALRDGVVIASGHTVDALPQPASA
jgi:thiol-disulfide isomerase/thioredoxin